MKRWAYLLTLPGGHKIFRSSDGRWAIADQSGSTPDNTDDGPLYIDESRAIFPTRPTWFLPLVNERGETSCTLIGEDDVVKVIGLTKIQVRLPFMIQDALNARGELPPEPCPHVSDQTQGVTCSCKEDG